MIKNSALIVAIVDDNQLARYMIKYIFDFNEIPVAFEAENGKECIEKINQSPKKPDIIILDLDMPIMNGLETTLIIKNKWPEIKIIAFSGNDHISNIDHIMGAGADYFQSKHEDPAELINIIYKLG